MKSDLAALVELIKPFAVEERQADQEPGKQVGWEADDRHDPFGRGDFVALMISIVILAFGIWWVTPW